MNKLTYQQAEQMAVEAAQAAMVQNYPAAAAELAKTGLFGKTLDRKARKLALRMGGFTLPEGWTIAMVTPQGWGANGYRRGGQS